MNKFDNSSSVKNKLRVKSFGLISLSTLYFIAIKNGSYYAIDSSIYKIFISKFSKIISFFEEIEAFDNIESTINNNKNDIYIPFDKKLQIEFNTKKSEKVNFEWLYLHKDEWIKINDYNTSSLNVNLPIDENFSIKLVISTTIDNTFVFKESNVVNIHIIEPDINILLDDTYTFTKGSDILIVPGISNLDLYKDKIKYKWMYLNNNEWVQFMLPLTNKLEIFDFPIDTNLLKIKLVCSINKYTYESNESIIKLSSIDAVISKEINVYENEIIKIDSTITIINCDMKQINYQWEICNLDTNEWQDIIGEKSPSLKFKANLNTNGNKYRLKILNKNLQLYSNICSVYVKENKIKIERVKSSYNIKEGATLSIVPEIFIDNGSIINAKYQWQVKDGDEWINMENQIGKNLLINLVPISLSGTLFRLIVDIDGKVSSIETTLFVTPLAYISISLEKNEFDFSYNSTLNIPPLVIYENCNEQDIVYQWMIRYHDSSWQNIKGAINKELILKCDRKELNNSYIKLVAWADGRYFESNLSRLILQSATLKLMDSYEIVEDNSVLIKPKLIDLVNINDDDLVYEWEIKKTNTDWVVLCGSIDLFIENANYDINFSKLRLKATYIKTNNVYYSNESTIIIKENDISILLENEYLFKEGDIFLIKPSITFVNEGQENVCSYQWQYLNENGQWLDSLEYTNRNIELDYTSLKWNEIYIRLVVSCLNKKFYSNKSLVLVSPSGSIKITFNEYEKNISNYSDFSIVPNIEVCDVNDECSIKYQWQFKYKDNQKWVNINNQNDKILSFNNFVSENNDPFDVRLTAIIDNKFFTSKSIRVKIV